MNDRLEELIRRLLDDEITDGESLELQSLAETNALAAARLKEARDFKLDIAAWRQSLVSDGKNAPESADVGLVPATTEAGTSPTDDETSRPAPTRMRTRILSALLLLALLVAVLSVPFIKREAGLLKLTSGKLWLGEHEIYHVEEPATVQVRDGERAVLTIRGGARLSLAGPGELRARARWPAALIEVLSGNVEITRAANDRECFVGLGDLVCAPDEGCALELETRPAFRVNVLSGVLSVREGRIRVARPDATDADAALPAALEGPGRLVFEHEGGVWRFMPDRPAKSER